MQTIDTRSSSRATTQTVFRVLMVLLSILILSSPLSAAFKKKAYADGTEVAVTGIVTDATGKPVAGLTLVLEGSRKAFKIKKLRRQKENPVRISTETNAKGEYSLSWQWHHYYNHFELRAGVPVRRPGGKQDLEVLASLELSQRMRQGTPVVASLTVPDRGFFDKMQTFLASIDTSDERNVFEELGKPDKVDTIEFPDRQEVSWWYFKQGKTYRFRDGKLDEVVDFDPILEVR